MQQRRYILVVLLAVAGYMALSLLAPRFDPAARWHARLDRVTAIERAREEARLSGLDTTNWRALVTTSYQAQTTYFISRYPAAAEKARLTPFITSVVLAEPEAEKRQWRVGLQPDGALDSFSLRGTGKTEQTQVSIESTRQVAARALTRILGDEASQFSLVSEIDQGAQGRQFIWERTTADDNDFNLQAICVVQGETIRELKLFTYFSPRFNDEYGARRTSKRMLDLLGLLLVLLVILVAAAFYLLGWARREINHRLALILLLTIFCGGILQAICGGALDNQLANNFETGAMHLTILGASLGLGIPVFFYAIMLVLLWSTGYALARRSTVRSFASFASLLRGRLWTKATAGRIAVGILLGGIIGAIPMSVAASGLFPNFQLNHPDPSWFVSRAPVIACLLRTPNLALWATYAFLSPLFNAHLRAPRLIRALTLVLGGVMLLDDTLYQTSLGAALVVAVLTIMFADWIFRRFDLLALIVAEMSAEATGAAWSLLLQPNGAIHTAGWRALAVLAAFLCVMLVISRKGRVEATAGEIEGMGAGGAGSAVQRAERERLVAEFGVARRAQQHMLPDVPPTIPGYEIAATCRPAREVGGDLYDFLVLPNERIGIVVADVSGKGVPAALYMTLTKGLLASVAEYESDPGAMLREVNRHLYEVCRRKVFVTMLFGVLDPSAQTFTYARAGHNPGVWRRASLQNSEWMRGAGLGLGLSSSKMFDRSLRAEEIRVERGDAVLLYSDGITEAMNAQGEEYGEQRLLDAVARTDGLSAAETQEAILADVGVFLDGTSPQDDMTLVVIRVAES